MFLTLLGSLAVFLALGGYCYVLAKTCHLDFKVTPVFVVSYITLLVYIAGFVGVLRPVSYALFVGGAVCFAYMVWSLKKHPISIAKISLFEGTVVAIFAVVMFLFLVQIFITELQHYDNYTHWLTVVKEMMLTNAFPTADSVMIEFTNYPLGAACFIYFVCTIAGTAHGAMLFAQALIIFACFFAVFSIVREHRVLLVLFLAAGLLVLTYFNVTIRFNNLLVDFLLPALCLAAIAITQRYRDTPYTAMFLCGPVLGLLVIVKSTGAIFALVAIGYLLYVVFAANAPKTIRAFFAKLAASITYIGVVFMPYVLWNLHVKIAFAGVENKFEVSTSVVSSAYGGKTLEEVQAIVTLFIQTLCDVSLRPTQGIVAGQLLAMLASFVAVVFLKKKWMLWKVLLALDIVLAGYFGGILAMYIYSMPIEEAIYLAGYERYASSIVVLFIGALVICATCDIARSFRYKLCEAADGRAFQSIETKNIYNKAVLACALIIFMLLTSELNGMAYNNATYEESLPKVVQDVVGDNWGDVDESTYLAYASDTDGQVSSYYFHYLMRYYLWTPNVDTLCSFYGDNMENLLSNYDYLVIVESDAAVQALMQEKFGLEGDVGIYEVATLLGDAAQS